MLADYTDYLFRIIESDGGIYQGWSAQIFSLFLYLLRNSKLYFNKIFQIYKVIIPIFTKTGGLLAVASCDRFLYVCSGQ